MYQNMKRICGLVLIFIGVSLFAEDERKPLIKTDGLSVGELDISAEFSMGFNHEGRDVFWQGLEIALDYQVAGFTLIADLVAKNDQKYAPARAMVQAVNFGGYYFFMNQGGLSYQNGNFYVEGGRLRLFDVVDSPYALFLSSLGNSANTFSLKYENPRFIYQTRWSEVNARNSVSSPAWNEYQRRTDPKTSSGTEENDTDGLTTFGFPDRGLNYKIYALKVQDWRVGFLDAAIYTGRSFDFEYFLNPIPQYFIQYVKGTPGRPWATASNENNLIGLFWDINHDKTSNKVWSAYAQVLVDDFAVPGVSQNPWKAAWALGGTWQTRIGRFGFHTGGALKYTFEPIGTMEDGPYAYDAAATAYGYTWYPETRYFDDESGGETVSILIQDNMIGYKYGENNIAFQVDYQNRFHKFLVNAELEFVLSGNNSPANPWQDYGSRSSYYNDGKKGSKLFDDGKLEKYLESRINVSYRLGNWQFFSALALGGKFGKLTLSRPDDTKIANDETTVDNNIWIWKASNKNEFIFRFSLGARYVFNVF
jgi:hypothetical protein